MKKLTANQKSVIHGGGCIIGAIYVISTVIGSVLLAKNLYDHFNPKENNDPQSPETEIVPDPKTFSNQIRSKNTILS